MNILILDVERLRTSCPWYQALTLEALHTYLAEESQEVLGAFAGGDPDLLKGELCQ